MMPRSYGLAAGALAVALAAQLEVGLGIATSGAISAAAMAGWLGDRRERWADGWRVFATAAVVGAWLVAARTLAGEASAGQRSPALPAGATWTAIVATVGGRGSGAQRAVLALEDVADSPLVYVRLPRYPEVTPGDRLAVRGRLEPLPDDPDPALAGFFAYLRRSGVVATTTVTAFELAGRVEGAAALLARARATGGDLLAEVLPEPQAGLAAGLLIGLRERVDRDLAADFTASGLSHVVAISGWNIAIVAASCQALTRRLRRRSRTFLVVAVVAAYAVAAGASPSVVRAALMAGVVLLAREGGRRVRAAPALALAVTAMLAIDPAVVRDPGFQLSAVATAGLLAWGTPLTERLAAGLPATMPRSLAETLGISFAAQAATLPIVLLDFGRLSLVAPMANLAVAPLVAPAMAATGLALAAGWSASLGVPGPLTVGLATPGALALGALVATARVAAAVPFATLELPAPLATVTAAAAVLGLAVAARSSARRALRRRLGLLTGRAPR